MTTGNINSNYKDLLKELDRVNTENTVSVFIPSIGKNCKFKALTVKQQKDIIKSAADSTLMNLSFNIVTNNIIKDNSIDSVEFKLHDKALVLIALRAATLSSTYTATNLEDSEDTIEVDLLKHIKTIKGVKFDKKSAEFTVTVDNIVVDCAAPSLKSDTAVNRDCLRNLSNTSTDVDDITQFKIIETVGDMYAYEIIKYIDTVTINPEDDDNRKVIDFNDLNTTQKVTVLEALPMSLSKMFLSNITEYKEYEALVTVIETGDNKYSISLDPGFFAAQ